MSDTLSLCEGCKQLKSNVRRRSMLMPVTNLPMRSQNEFCDDCFNVLKNIHNQS